MMEVLPKPRLLQFVERAVELAYRAVSWFSTRYSRKRFTLRRHVALLCLKVKKTTTYRDLVDELIEMPRIRAALNLGEIPRPIDALQGVQPIGDDCLACSTERLP